MLFGYLNIIDITNLSNNNENNIFSPGVQQILVPLSWESYQQAEDAYVPPGEHTKMFFFRMEINYSKVQH
jgi:hypothetical protein